MPSLFDLATISRRRDTYIVRQERLKREGSPYYPWNVPATAAGATAVIYVPTQFPDSRKYEPLDWLEIVNNEPAIDLYLTLNGGTVGFSVPASTIRTIDNYPLWHVAVRNDHASATTTLNKVRVTLRRQPLTMDKWIRR